MTERDVLVSTATRTIVMTRGRYSVYIDGKPVLVSGIPEFGQLSAAVESEADVLHALCVAGYRVGGNEPIEIYGRCAGIMKLLEGVPSRAISEFLGLDASRPKR